MGGVAEIAYAHVQHGDTEQLKENSLSRLLLKVCVVYAWVCACVTEGRFSKVYRGVE